MHNKVIHKVSAFCLKIWSFNLIRPLCPWKLSKVTPAASWMDPDTKILIITSYERNLWLVDQKKSWIVFLHCKANNSRLSILICARDDNVVVPVWVRLVSLQSIKVFLCAFFGTIYLLYTSGWHFYHSLSLFKRTTKADRRNRNEYFDDLAKMFKWWFIQTVWSSEMRETFCTVIEKIRLYCKKDDV